MPLTISHAAAALPVHALSGKRLPLAALMVGSMAPDFAYFVPVPTTRFETHGLAGLFVFCLPAGLAVWWAFVRFMQAPTIALIPAAWRAGLAPPPARISPSLLLGAALGVLLGAVTHIVWDWFTHAHTPVSDAFPALRETSLSFGRFRMPLYYFLQIVSSLIGLGALAWWAWRLRTPDADAPVRAQAPAPDVLPAVSPRTRVGAVIALLLTSLLFATLYGLSYEGHRVESRIFYVAIGMMSGCLLAWIGIVAWINARWRIEREI